MDLVVILSDFFLITLPRRDLNSQFQKLKLYCPHSLGSDCVYRDIT